MIDKLQNKSLHIDFGKGKPPIERGECPRCGAKIEGTVEVAPEGQYRSRATSALHCTRCTWAASSEATLPNG
jgi:hypothetical protein